MENRTEARTIVPEELEPETFGAARPEVVPGYTLEERIGSGGFGEVWRATAPGGLLKAIKIVFGGMGDRHAVAELKSLERIKSVRHPFILTLERIDIVDDRLIIISELAESSLQDHLQQVTAAGHVGIERNELLRYLHDAADALDYMSQQHSLQHLDIKPENLLLIGGHVKVADFGLTKDLQDASLSTMGGMTPAYTAPEVFSGTPGPFSDQYSLACTYQVLLTGKHPFPGNTMAELVSQQLHSAPDVSGLPVHDQSVMLRALSKSPGRRFSCSREFVEALIAAGQPKERLASTDTGRKHATAAPNSPRPSQAETASNDQHDSVSGDEASLQHLGPLANGTFAGATRPTLVIGLGGLATSVLQSLKRQLAERFPKQQTPAFQFLAIDTDEKALFESMHDTDSDDLHWDECLPIRLKPSCEYLNCSRNLAGWISRRWLFNIPRSLRTEGIRALGRLAFVDQFQEIEAALRKSLAEITAEEALQKTAESTGMDEWNTTPRVFVVSSTSGGTGSGMLLDVAYAVRGLLRSMHLSDQDTTGVLLHDVHGTANRGPLYSANALACIRELQHFCREQHYDGDAAAGIPAVSDARPFESAYVMPLTRPIGGSAALAARDVVAEFLLQSFAGSCSGLFDHLRTIADGGDLMPKIKSIVAEKLVTPCAAEERPETEFELKPSSMQLWDSLMADDDPEPTEIGENRQSETDSGSKPSDENAIELCETVVGPIDTLDIEAGLDQIGSLLRQVEEPAVLENDDVLPVDLDAACESSTERPQLEPTTEAPTAVESGVEDPWDPMQRGNTVVLSFSADSLFEQLWKTRGTVRLLFAGSDDALEHYQPTLGEVWDNQFTHVTNDDPTAFVCFEVDGIPLCDVTNLIESLSPDSGKLADQLTTRIDIDWSR